MTGVTSPFHVFTLKGLLSVSPLFSYRKSACLPRCSSVLSLANTSSAARSPERIAHSMYPIHFVEVSVPAEWMRPCGWR